MFQRLRRQRQLGRAKPGDGSALKDLRWWQTLTRTLVGATFVGPEASELLHAATIAIVGAVPVHALRHAVPSYPAASELWLRLLEELPREMRAG